MVVSTHRSGIACKVRCAVPGPVGCLLQILVLQPSRIGYLLLRKKQEKALILVYSLLALVLVTEDRVNSVRS